MSSVSRHNVEEAKTCVQERGLEAARERVGPHYTLMELQIAVEELSDELAVELEPEPGSRVAEP